MTYQLVLSVLVLLPSIIAAVLNRKKDSLWLLLIGALVVRLLVIGLDPFLHDWDERFHAIVAKNMILHPFQPMMHLEVVVPYEIGDWCCNYIWLHKQPLFLWQMALSMKIFGVNTIALRLPSALLGVFSVYCVYRITEIWGRRSGAAYIAALLFACSYYGLELCSGRLGTDHNDIAMGAYVTASLWAFCEYTEKKSWKWAIWAGVFAGCAVLVKWLTGLLLFGGWGIYLLADKDWRTELSTYKHWAGALLSAVLVFLPWQIYIMVFFPAESAESYALNHKHLSEDLGHPGDSWMHFAFMPTAFSGPLLLLLMAAGLVLSFRPTINRRMSLAMLLMFAVVYCFFSFFVATKMPGFTYPVAAIGFAWIGMGAHFLARQASTFTAFVPQAVYVSLATLLLFGLCLYAFQAAEIADARKPDNPERMHEMHNTAIYRHLNEFVAPDEVILNCTTFEDTELRFWQPNNAYHWYPKEHEVDDILQRGYKLTFFKSHKKQILPVYILNNPKIRILDLELD